MKKENQKIEDWEEEYRKFWVNGVHYPAAEIRDFIYQLLQKERKKWEKEIYKKLKKRLLQNFYEFLEKMK